MMPPNNFTPLGTPHLISGGGGGLEKIEINSLSPQSQKKKFVDNVGRKKSLSSKLMENMLTSKNTKW